MKTIGPLCGILLGLVACGSPGRDVVVDVDSAPTLPANYEIGREVGLLLSANPADSKAAEQRLIALDEARRERFLAYAVQLQGERDVRLLHVLDEHHALPAMPVDQKLDFLLWKATRPERYFVMKAQSRLIDMARADPAPLIRRLRTGAPGSEILGVVLAVGGHREVFPVLLERYRGAASARERAAAAEALGLLAGEERRPRPSGSAAEIARDAGVLEAWYREHLDAQAEAAEAAAMEGR